MKLQLLGNYHSPVLSGKGGEIFDNVDDRVGLGLIEAGYAKRLDTPPAPPQETPPADAGDDALNDDILKSPDAGEDGGPNSTPPPVVRRPISIAKKK